jgi:hypothetical protein
VDLDSNGWVERVTYGFRKAKKIAKAKRKINKSNVFDGLDVLP